MVLQDASVLFEPGGSLQQDVRVEVVGDEQAARLRVRATERGRVIMVDVYEKTRGSAIQTSRSGSSTRFGAARLALSGAG